MGIILATLSAIQAGRDRDVAERESTRSALAAAQSTLAGGDAAVARDYLERIPPSRRGWEWRVVAGRAAEATRVISAPFLGRVVAAAFGHERPILALCDFHEEGGAVWIVSADTLEFVDSHAVPVTKHYMKCAFRPGDAELVVVGSQVDGSGFAAVTLDLSGRRITNQVPIERGVALHALSADGRLVVVGGDDDYHTWVFDTASGSLVYESDDLEPLAAGFGAGGRLLSSHRRDQSIRIVDLETGQDFWSGGPKTRSSAIAPHQARLVVPKPGGVVEAWDLEPERTLVSRFRSHGFTVAVSPSGDRIAGVGASGSLYVHEISTVRDIGPFGAHEGNLSGPPVFSPDSELVVTIPGSAPPRVWSIPASASRALTGHSSYVYAVTALCDADGIGEVLISGGGTASTTVGLAACGSGMSRRVMRSDDSADRTSTSGTASPPFPGRPTSSSVGRRVVRWSGSPSMGRFSGGPKVITLRTSRSNRTRRGSP